MMKGKKIYSRLSILIVIILLIAGTQVLAAAPAKVIGVKANPTSTSVTITWNSVSAIKGYEVEINIPGLGYVKQGQVKSTTKTITGLEPGTTYSVRVRAVRDSVTGPYSNEVRFTTPRGSSNSGGNSNGGSSNSGNTRVGTVSGVRANPGNTSVTVSWNRVSGASRYEVAINIPGLGYVEQRETNDTTQTITGLEPGTTYYAKVRAIGNGGYGSYSNEVRFTTPISSSTTGGTNNGGGSNSGTAKPGQVQNLRTTSVKETFMTFAFNPVSNATGYEVYTRKANESYSYAGIVTATHVELGGLTAGTTYYVKVRAYNSAGYGAESAELRFTTPISSSTTGGTNNGGGSNSGTAKPGQVQNLRTTSVKETFMTFAFNPVSNATGYEVYTRKENESYSCAGIVTATHVELGGLTAGTTYYVKVRAYNSAGYGAESAELKFTTPISSSTTGGINNGGGSNSGTAKPGQVQSLRTTSVKETFMTFAFNPVSNATGYEVYTRKENESYSCAGIVTATHVELGGLTAGTTYYLKVRAYNSAGYGAESAELKFTTPISSSTTGGINNGGGSNSGTAKPGQVQNLRTTSVKETFMTFAFNPVSNATGYEVYTRKENESYSCAGIVTATHVELGGLTAGTTYYIKVRAYNSAGYGAESAELKFTTPISSSTTGGTNNGGGSNSGTAKPGQVQNLRTTSVKETFMTFAFNPVSNATGYEVYIRTENGSYSYAGRVTANHVELGGLTAGTTYYLKVRAYNSAGYGAESAELKFTTPISSSTTGGINNGGGNNSGTAQPGQVKNLRTTSVKETFMTFAFNTVSNATGYEVYTRTENGSYSYAGRVTSNHVQLNTLTPGTTYYLKVRAYNSAGYGAESAELKFTTPISSSTTGEANNGGSNSGTTVGQVKNVRVSNITATTMVVSWDGVAKATGYEVYVEIPGIGYVFVRNVNSTTTDVTGFTPGTTYKTKIRAYEIVNGRKIFGSDSNEITFTTQK